jgi:hypothetical protein
LETQNHSALVEFLGIIKSRKLILVDEKFVNRLQEADQASLPEEYRDEKTVSDEPSANLSDKSS